MNFQSICIFFYSYFIIHLLLISRSGEGQDRGAQVLSPVPGTQQHGADPHRCVCVIVSLIVSLFMICSTQLFIFWVSRCSYVFLFTAFASLLMFVLSVAHQSCSLNVSVGTMLLNTLQQRPLLGQAAHSSARNPRRNPGW